MAINLKDEKIIRKAVARLKKAIEDDGDNRQAAKDDLEFTAIDGKQWPESVRAEREAEGRPCLTINKMPVFIDQVVGDQRMNRPSIKVFPVDSSGDKAIANILSGWIKHVQHISKADSVIDHGFEHAVTCGYGAWRVVTKYVSDNSFDQEAYIQKIDNALSVYWGKHSEYDCSDAQYCFIVSDMDRDEYKDKYKEEPIPFKDSDDQFVDGWSTKDTVRVAEYFVKEKISKTIYLLDGGEIVEKAEIDQVVLKQRKVDAFKIMWYLLSGDRILDRREWPGKKYIPIVPVWGKELNVAGKRVIRGLIRNAKDPQRMFNYWEALSLNTSLPTPNGWIKMADVQIGQHLFDDKGKVCNVTAISPVFKDRECSEVLFDDGSVITADIKHLWTVEERGKRTSKSFTWNIKTLTTDQLVPKKHFIWVTDPLVLPEKDFLIPPYVLGTWLGDGNTSEPCITQSPEDWEELVKHLKFFGCDIRKPRNSGTTVAFTMLGMRSKFIELNLLENKHIPYYYIRGSFKQRLELLQGLMDTDGSVGHSSGQCSFTTILPELAKGFAELLRTLGIKVKCIVRNKSKKSNVNASKLQYQFDFTTRLPVFRFERKLASLGKVKAQNRRTERYSIKSITSVKSEPVKCVTVDSKSSLYLAGIGMVPTHNSSDTETVALQPKSPYILTPTQVAGHEQMWKNSLRKNYPYLLVSPDRDAPGWPKREAPPQVSSAMVNKIQGTDQEIRDTIGLQKASLGMQSNERSGTAIRERKKEGDIGTFSFIDNLARSVEHTGRILVDIASAILDTKRVIRIGGEDDDDVNFVTVNMVTPDGKIFNDLSIGTYDVRVTVGPSSTTQRTEAQISMKEFIQYYPSAAPVIGDLYAKSMDWPGAEKVAKRLEYLLPPVIREEIEAKRAAKDGNIEPPVEKQEDPGVIAEREKASIELEEIKVSLEVEKIKLGQEKAKLETINLQNDLIIKESKESIKIMMDEINAEGVKKESE